MSSLSISQVLSQASSSSSDILYINDGPIHYIVLTRDDNKLSLPFIDQYIAILDQIEATKGPSCLITIGTGPKIFSSGFDLHYWL